MSDTVMTRKTKASGKAGAGLPHYASVEDVIAKMNPAMPVYVLHPNKFRTAAKRFPRLLSGDTLFAIKANPHPHVLEQVYEAGIRHFDTASLPEIVQVKTRFPRRALPLHGPGAQPRRGEGGVQRIRRHRLCGGLRLRTRQAAGRDGRREALAHLRAHRHAARRRAAGALQQVRHDAGRRRAPLEARGGVRRGAGAHLPCRLAVPVALLLCAGDRDGQAHGGAGRRGHPGARSRRRLSRPLPQQRRAARPLVFRYGEAGAGNAAAENPRAVRAGPRAGGRRHVAHHAGDPAQGGFRFISTTASMAASTS